ERGEEVPELAIDARSRRLAEALAELVANRGNEMLEEILLVLVAAAQRRAAGTRLIFVAADDEPGHRLAKQAQMILDHQAFTTALDAARRQPLAHFGQRSFIGEAGQIDAGMKAHRRFANRDEGVVVGLADLR